MVSHTLYIVRPCVCVHVEKSASFYFPSPSVKANLHNSPSTAAPQLPQTPSTDPLHPLTAPPRFSQHPQSPSFPKGKKKKKKKPNLMHARITACEVALWETPPSLSSALYALISASYLFHIPPLRRDLFLISLYTGPQLKMFICNCWW